MQIGMLTLTRSKSNVSGRERMKRRSSMLSFSETAQAGQTFEVLSSQLRQGRLSQKEPSLQVLPELVLEFPKQLKST